MECLTAERQQVVLEHLWLAEKVAERWWWRFHKRPDLEEYVAASYFGLCRAALTDAAPENFQAYIRTACRNAIFDERKQWANRVTKSPRSECVPDKMLSKMILAETIQRLTPCLCVVMERRLWGHKLNEIALELGISQDAARKRSSDAAQKIREELGQDRPA